MLIQTCVINQIIIHCDGNQKPLNNIRDNEILYV